MPYGDTRDTFADLMGQGIEGVVRSVLALQQNSEQANWLPRDYGLLAWSYDPIMSVSQVMSPGGTLYLTRLHLRQSMTITNLVTHVLTAGVTLTAGQCFAALFDGNLNLKAATADQSAAWVSIGQKVMPLSTPQVMPAGDILIGAYYNGTTGPALPRAANNPVGNTGLATAASRFASSTTGLTTAMPATAGALVATTNTFWWGVS